MTIAALIAGATIAGIALEHFLHRIEGNNNHEAR